MAQFVEPLQEQGYRILAPDLPGHGKSGSKDVDTLSSLLAIIEIANRFGPVHAIVGIALLIAWIVFLRATFLSLGWLGIILWGALFAAIVWFFVDIGWLALDSTSAISWVVLLLLALTLTVGMSWSHIRRQLTGVSPVDDVEE